MISYQFNDNNYHLILASNPFIFEEKHYNESPGPKTIWHHKEFRR
jgi:hypothetical protein